MPPRSASHGRAAIPPPRIGGLIDRAAPLNFTFDGKTFAGFQGDTLASALVANGVKLVGRSFKYHRPRGILTAGSEEPNALVELRSGARREPNTKATTAELYDGLEAAQPEPLAVAAPRSDGGQPAVLADLRRRLLLQDLHVAGEILGGGLRAGDPPRRRSRPRSGRADPDHYDKAWAHCDVLIAGGGPPGLAAALAAGRAGARVILCEEDFALGGRLLADGGKIDGMPAAEWISRTLAELASLPDVRIMTPHDACSASMMAAPMARCERVNDHLPSPPEHQVRQRLWRIVGKALRRCGRRHRAADRVCRQRHARRDDGFGDAHLCRSAMRQRRRRRIALFTNNEDGWRTVEAALGAGLQIAAVIDARPDIPPRIARWPPKPALPSRTVS